MKVFIKYGDSFQEFKDKHLITIGNNGSCDIEIKEITFGQEVKLVYSKKYNNYVLVNSSKSSDILLNNSLFSKALAGANFHIDFKDAPTILVSVDREEGAQTKSVHDIFDNEIEQKRISIVKEMGYTVQELKNSVSSMNFSNFVLNCAIVILSVVSSFGMTNFLLGLRVQNTASVLNLTTNVGFLICISFIVLAIALILRGGVSSLFEFNSIKKYGDSGFIHKLIIGFGLLCLFIVYVMNLFYYKDIPGFSPAALFISFLFAGSLCVVAVASGYFRYKLRVHNQDLNSKEFRPDFESVIKNYVKLIYKYVNSLSENRLNSVRSSLLNCQFRMTIEIIIGVLTAPFLAYGVSNTLAMCFPEAASYIRVSGIRFSPIFLVLATFMIIFAFFSFVRGFTISKQMKSSEIIKFDGFHDYNSHGVTVLGLDAMKSLNKERNIVMFIACFIILIEFTMNVSYFVGELGGDIQGMFLSFVTALVPTALLIAETHLLSSTMHKINNYNELLLLLD